MAKICAFADCQGLMNCERNTLAKIIAQLVFGQNIRTFYLTGRGLFIGYVQDVLDKIRPFVGNLHVVKIVRTVEEVKNLQSSFDTVICLPETTPFKNKKMDYKECYCKMFEFVVQKADIIFCGAVNHQQIEFIRSFPDKEFVEIVNINRAVSVIESNFMFFEDLCRCFQILGLPACQIMSFLSDREVTLTQLNSLKITQKNNDGCFFNEITL